MPGTNVSFFGTERCSQSRSGVTSPPNHLQFGSIFTPYEAPTSTPHSVHFYNCTSILGLRPSQDEAPVVSTIHNKEDITRKGRHPKRAQIHKSPV